MKRYTSKMLEWSGDARFNCCICVPRDLDFSIEREERYPALYKCVADVIRIAHDHPFLECAWCHEQGHRTVTRHRGIGAFEHSKVNQEMRADAIAMLMVGRARYMAFLNWQHAQLHEDGLHGAARRVACRIRYLEYGIKL